MRKSCDLVGGDGQSIREAAEKVLKVGRYYIQKQLWDCQRTVIGKNMRYLMSGRGVRKFLKVPNPRHRVALTRLLASDHHLAVEEERRSRIRIEREDRLCRRCGLEVEDEVHVLLGCEGDEMICRRRVKFLELMRRYNAKLAGELYQDKPCEALSKLLDREECVPHIAESVFSVLDSFDGMKYYLTLL
jgi:hypothetical protein